MKYHIAPVENNDYILIEVHGVINRQIGPQIISEAHKLGLALGIDKFLMDLTDAVNDDSTLDQYQFANRDIADAENLNRYAKIAVLVDPDDHSHDFIETVLRNIGINLKLFLKRDEAMAFLGLHRTAGQRQI